MSRLVSEVWLQRCQLSSHAFSVVTFLTHHVTVYRLVFKHRVIWGGGIFRENNASYEAVNNVYCQQAEIIFLTKFIVSSASVTVLPVGSLRENHGRKERPRNILTDDCKENIGTRQRRRNLENKNKQGYKGHIEGGIYFNIYEVPLITMVWSC